MNIFLYSYDFFQTFNMKEKQTLDTNYFLLLVMILSYFLKFLRETCGNMKTVNSLFALFNENYDVIFCLNQTVRDYRYPPLAHFKKSAFPTFSWERLSFRKMFFMNCTDGEYL